MSLTQFTSITGTCVPVLGPDMDTDRIIPARFLKCITFDELAGVMFWDERFDENGQSKSHPVDDPRFKGASIIWAAPTSAAVLPANTPRRPSGAPASKPSLRNLSQKSFRQQHRNRVALRMRVCRRHCLSVPAHLQLPGNGSDN